MTFITLRLTIKNRRYIMYTMTMKYHWNFQEELAEEVNNAVKALEMAVITILSLLVCFFVNFEIIASDLVRILLLLISIIAVVAVIVASFIAVAISEKNEAISKRIAEFLIARKLVIGKMAEID